MTNDKKVIATQLVGILVLILAMFGIDVTPEQQAQIVSGLSAFGLVLTAVLVRFGGRGKE